MYVFKAQILRFYLTICSFICVIINIQFIIFFFSHCFYCFYCFFTEDLAYLKVPLHSVIKLTPVAYGCRDEFVSLNIDAVNTIVINQL